MTDVRKYWDGARQWSVNVRTGVASYQEDGVTVYPDHETEAKVVAKVRARVRGQSTRKAKDQIRRDMGLVKVRGALGGIYWE